MEQINKHCCRIDPIRGGEESQRVNNFEMRKSEKGNETQTSIFVN